jgi:hypothetical protein
MVKAWALAANVVLGDRVQVLNPKANKSPRLTHVLPTA